MGLVREGVARPLVRSLGKAFSDGKLECSSCGNWRELLDLALGRTGYRVCEAF